MTALLLLAATASGIATPGPLLLLAALALAVRAVEALRAIDRPRDAAVRRAVEPVSREYAEPGSTPPLHEQVVATIYERSGRLRLRRRQPSSGGD